MQTFATTRTVGAHGARLSRLTSLGFVAAILVVYLVLAYLYATRVPIWNAPDEPAHFNYVRHIAATGSLPVLRPGDYDVERIERAMSLQFPASEPVDWMRYESHQPPLYYVVATPVYLISDDLPIERQVVVLRMLSTLFASALIVVTFFLIREVAPNSPALQRFVPAFVAFVPMHVAMTAAVSNDPLAELLVACTLLIVVRMVRHGVTHRRQVLLGILLGLIVLTKLVAYAAIPVAALGLYAAGRLHDTPEQRSRRFIVRLVVVGVIAAAIGGWWFIRNLVVYGGIDVVGLARHDEVVTGQPLTGPITREAAQRFLLTTFRSFWGQFGWMGAPLGDREYLVLAMATGLAFLGALLYAWRVAHQAALVEPWRRWSAALLLLTAVLVFAQMALYNLTYLQPQGRYLFPALAVLATVFGVGWRELWHERYQGLMLGLLGIGLAGLAAFALVEVVVPYFR